MKHDDDIIDSGSLVVTGEGEMLLDEQLPRDTAIEDVCVEFDPDVVLPPCAPCDGNGGYDELDFAILGEDCDHLRLKIFWKCASVRTIRWRVKQKTSWLADVKQWFWDTKE